MELCKTVVDENQDILASQHVRSILTLFQLLTWRFFNISRGEEMIRLHPKRLHLESFLYILECVQKAHKDFKVSLKSRIEALPVNDLLFNPNKSDLYRILRIHYNDPLGMITNDPSTLEKLRMADNSGSHSSGRDRSYFVVNQKTLPYKSFIESFHETFKISKTLITKINNVWVRI